MNDPTVYPCPAKVNLALSVGAPRADGMHPICSWMARVSFQDDLTLRPLDDPHAPSTFAIDWADDAPQPSPFDNRVARAWCCSWARPSRKRRFNGKRRTRQRAGSAIPCRFR